MITLRCAARWFGAVLLPLLLGACAGAGGGAGGGGVSAPAAPPVNTLVNTLGMAFVRLPAGEFWMGHQEPVASWAQDLPQYPPKRFTDLSDEAPVHRVRITRDFYLGQHEVTVGQFRRFLERSGHVPESVADGTGGYGYNPAYDPATSASGDAFEGRHPRYSWAHVGFVQDDSHPVLNVTWNDAVAMARWLSRAEGRRYRLPTEAEWEYACRAGSQTRYPNGRDPQRLTEIANTFDSSAAADWPQWSNFALRGSDGFAFTAPVGQFAPNAWGLHDMLGNAWEWVSDHHGDDYHAQAASAPLPAVDPQGPATGHVRVRRGGSWHSWALYARCSYRNWNAPSTRYTLVGMRLLLEAD